jgi:hypothetical protein
MATSTTSPPKPTFGPHEWLMKTMTASHLLHCGNEMEAVGDTGSVAVQDACQQGS